jgi:N-acetylmuramoyl-L-alanine amidase
LPGSSCRRTHSKNRTGEVGMSGKRILFLIATFVLLFAQFISAQPKIEIIYPKEGDQVIASDSTFIFGNVWPWQSFFYVNGKRAKVYPNGTFLAVVPVKPGSFTFFCRAFLQGESLSKQRNVYIPHFLETSKPDSLTLDSSYVFPKEDWSLNPGDIFKVAVKGTPNCKATFSIEGTAENLPMTELPPKRSYHWGEARFGQSIHYQMSEVRGIYTGSYIFQSWDWAENRKIIFRLHNDSGKTVEITAPGKLSINQSTIPKIAQLKEDVMRARSGPRIGNQLFLQKGVKVYITGKRGDDVRVRFSEKDEIWIKRKSLEFLPPGSTLPEAIVSAIRTSGQEKWSSVEVILDQRLPFRVEQTWRPASLEITFYGVSTNSDSMRLDLNDAFFRDISWHQKERNAYTLKIDLNQKQHWGYDPVYNNGNLTINVKKKPKIARWPNSPLKNIVVCLDPGHSPETGTIGPSGVMEKDINFEYCEQLKTALEEKGAVVVFTHGKFDGIDIESRSKMAAFLKADILLSLHFNALPDGVNPFKPRGISTYYNQPHSYRLAYLIQNNLLEKTKARNFGFHYSTFAVCRTPQMISVLTEPGFLTIPEEEKLITSESYQKKVVNAIKKALEQFLKESR